MENTKEPIRILQCVSNMDRAGIETILMNFYRLIDKNEIQFDFICNKSKKGAYDDEIKQMGGNIYISPGLNPLKWFQYKKFMKKILDNYDYKIIHCQNETMGYYALKCAQKFGVPVRIAHSHNTLIRKDLKYFIKKYCKNHLQDVSNVQVACGRDAGRFLFEKDVKIIRNAIDTERFIYNEKTRNIIRKEMGLEGKFVIGNIARFEPQKNHEFIIDLFNEYHKIDGDSVLLLVGDGTLMEKIMEKVNNYNLSDSVIFTGNIPNPNEMYQIMDIFILPSYHEGLPVVGVEAQTSGLPCIFSNNVTDEIKINDNVEFIEINHGFEQWIESIKKYKSKANRLLAENVIKAGYDINTETKKLVDWYLDLYNKAIKGDEK